MPGNGQTETFTIRIDSNAAKTAREDAAELENLRKRFDATTSSLKQHETALRRLQQGGVVNIATARDLKSKIEAEKNALAEMTEKVTNAGKSFEGLSVQAKKNEDKLKESRAAAMAFADAAGGAVVAALLAVEVASLAAAGGLAHFILESANLARSQQLARAAVTGSEEDARRLGSQVDALAMKVPKARSEINDLAVDMRRSGLMGQTLVDTLNATVQASSAIGDQAAGKIREFVERSKLMGNFALNPLELQGTGLGFNDVAEALAKNTKTSLAEAQTALLQGRVRLGEGAAALRTAIEKKFGGVNLAKMLDFDVMKRKVGELLQSLTSGINIEPMLNALKDFFAVFDQSTETGQALKKLVTVFGETLVTAISTGLPIAKGFFEELVLDATKLYREILKLELRFYEAFGPNVFKNIDLVSTGAKIAKVAIATLTVAVGLLGVTTAIALIPLVTIVAGLALGIGIAVAQWMLLKKGFDAVVDFVPKFARALGNKESWKNLGADIVQGLLDPLLGFARRGEEIGSSFKAGFKKALGIASPSKVFREYGENTAEGFGSGVERRAPFVADKLENMAAAPASSSGGAGGGVTVTMPIGNITIQVDGSRHHDAASLVAEIRSQFQGELTRAIERALATVGQPTAPA